MNWLNTYWLVAVALDWASTIEAHNYRVEKTPLMRWVWMEYGDMGFTAMTILAATLFSVAIWLSLKLKMYPLVALCIFPVITFKILIALTNLAVIPYWVTGWY